VNLSGLSQLISLEFTEISPVFISIANQSSGVALEFLELKNYIGHLKLFQGRSFIKKKA
jgi:hypothetical protein